MNNAALTTKMMELREEIKARAEPEFKRKIIGVIESVEEKVQLRRATTNVKVEEIKRITTKMLALECGHKIPMTRFPGGAPKYKTVCSECIRESLGR